jgi:hypothetical protein
VFIAHADSGMGYFCLDGHIDRFKTLRLAKATTFLG